MRFSPNDFQHNGRVCFALVPALTVLAGYGGTLPLGTFLVGSMVTYILDTLRYREGALAAIWIMLGATNFGLILTTVFLSQDRNVLSLLIALTNGLLLFLTGTWGTLQFRWVQLQYPVAIIAAEKLLLSCCLPVGGIMMSWGLVAALGASTAPFYAAAWLCSLYMLLGRPLSSSFMSQRSSNHSSGESLKGSKEGDSSVLSASEGFTAAALVVLLPLAMYLATHWGQLLESVNLWSLVLLGSAPLLLITCLQDGLWWLPLPHAQQHLVRRVLLLLSLVAALAGLEGRVLFRAFGQYMGLQPPWSYVVVSFALYGGAALSVLYLAGLLGEILGSTMGAVALVLCGGAAALALGMPPLTMPAPMLAASGLVLFHESRTLRDYSIFAVGATVSGAWFVVHHHWFLDVWLAGWSLQAVCVAIIFAMGLGLLLPGVVTTRAPPGIVGAVAVAQAAVVALLEEHLYAGEHEIGSDDVYPAFLVVLTSAVGIAMTHHMAAHMGRLDELSAWLLYCIYGSKCAMLLLPESRMALPVLFVALTATAPVLLYGGQSVSQNSKQPRRQLPPWLALFHCVCVFTSVIVARFAIFDALSWMGGRPPPEGLLVGAIILALAAGCAPLTMRFYSQDAGIRRVVLLAGAFGLTLVLLQPPLPIQGGAECPHLPFGLCPRIWDDMHVPERLADDAAIWGDPYMAARAHWPLWLLAAAAVAALSAGTQQDKGGLGGPGLLGHVAACGGCVGAYLALELFVGQYVLQVFAIATTVTVAAVLLLLRLPVRSAPSWLPALVVLWGAALPLELAVGAVLPLPPLPVEDERLYPDDSMRGDERLQGQRTALLAIHAAQALLLAFAFRLKVSAAASQAGFLGACLPAGLHMPGAGSSTWPGLSREGLQWLPATGNATTLLCLGLCLWLNATMLEGSDEAVLVLAPLLLLLNHSPATVSVPAHQHRRYAPCVAAVALYLAGSCLWQLSERTGWALDPLRPKESGIGIPWDDFIIILRDLMALVLVLPHHALFLQFLWSQSKMPPITLLALAPLSALGGLMTAVSAVQWLAGLGLGAAVTQYLAMRHISHQAQKFI
ncbi:hypothetical protein WJX73_005937 [Symbiochloris irregularis]|uniref:Uncharacterized protein n=1 Tax=Symbiochloris irregularis TaxID=706552 RepID=A0AAW1NNG5_9CHLO